MPRSVIFAHSAQGAQHTGGFRAERHTYATTLYRAGVDLRTAQKLMGHSSIQVTADIYTHLEQEDSLHVADKLNEYLSGKSENSAKSSQKVVKLAI